MTLNIHGPVLKKISVAIFGSRKNQDVILGGPDDDVDGGAIYPNRILRLITTEINNRT
jgi:hypothetical protein